MAGDETGRVAGSDWGGARRGRGGEKGRGASARHCRHPSNTRREQRALCGSEDCCHTSHAIVPLLRAQALALRPKASTPDRPSAALPAPRVTACDSNTFEQQSG
eukprot:366451-Chlamydomonas_euryale.AAC.2